MKKPTKAEVLKKKDNYVRIKFGYSCTYILPYEAGMAILANFENAEFLDQEDYDNPCIKGLPTNQSPEVTLMSEESYLNYKMSGLLGVAIDPEKPPF